MRWNLFVALVLSACCTMRGFLAGISFELSQEAADALVQGRADLRTCFNGTCWDETFEPDGGGTSMLDAVTFDETSRTLSQRQKVTPGDTAEVTLTATRDGGTLFTHSWSNVKFKAVYANGALCGIDGYTLGAPLKF